MTEEKDERRNFYEKELWPQLNTEKFLLDRAEGAKNQGKLEDAMLYLESALLVNPQNSQAQDKIKEIRKLRVKLLAHDFIRRFYPSELKLFNLAWRIFNGITPKDLTQEVLSGSLGIVGREASELKTPKVIVLFNQVSSENIEALPDENAKEVLAKIGHATGCSGELLDKATKFILGT